MKTKHNFVLIFLILTTTLTQLIANPSDISNLRVENITAHSVDVIWDGNPNAKTWVHVYAPYDITGPKHSANNNTYSYLALASNINFTVYVQGENSDIILEKFFATTPIGEPHKYKYEITEDANMNIIDITNPNNIYIVGEINFSTGGEYDNIQVITRGNYAYIATGYYLHVIDISDKSNPQIIKTIIVGDDYMGETYFLESFNIYDNEIYIYVTTYGDRGYLNRYNISNPTNPILTDTITPGYILEYKIVGEYIYIKTGHYPYTYPKEVKLYKRDYKLKEIKFYPEYSDSNGISNSLSDYLKISNDKSRAYIILNYHEDEEIKNPTLYIINHTDEENPTIGTISWQGVEATSLKLNEEKNEIYITDKNGDIKRIDISDESNPTLLNIAQNDVSNIRVKNISYGSFDILWDGNPNAKIFFYGLPHLGKNNKYTFKYYNPEIWGSVTVQVQGVGSELTLEKSFNISDSNTDDNDISSLVVKNITDHSVDISWTGNSNAKTWVHVHGYDVNGSKHDTTNNKYSYSALGPNLKFTVYVESEESGKILQKEFKTLDKMYVSNLKLTNITDHGVDVSWDGNPNAKTWVYVHELEVKGPKHNATDHKYSYSSFASDTIFTVYIQGEGSDNIIKKHFRTLKKSPYTRNYTPITLPDYVGLQHNHGYGYVKKTTSQDGTKVIYYNGVYLKLYDISNPDEAKLLTALDYKESNGYESAISKIGFLSNNLVYIDKIYDGWWISDNSFIAEADMDTAFRELHSNISFYDISSNELKFIDGFYKRTVAGALILSKDETKVYFPSSTGLEIIDISNPHQPIIVNKYHTHGCPISGVTSKDKIKLYLLLNDSPDEEGSASTDILDISDPSHPKDWDE